MFLARKKILFLVFIWCNYIVFVSLSIDNQLNIKFMNTNAQVKEEVKNVKKVADLKLVETTKVAVEPKKEAISLASKIEEKIAFLTTSVQDRIRRGEQFQVLTGKFNFLKQKEDELSKFVLSSDGTKEKIELSNQSGFKLVVSNTQTIEKVLKVIEEDLSAFVLKSEKEIADFIV